MSKRLTAIPRIGLALSLAFALAACGQAERQPEEFGLADALQGIQPMPEGGMATTSPDWLAVSPGGRVRIALYLTNRPSSYAEVQRFTDGTVRNVIRRLISKGIDPEVERLNISACAFRRPAEAGTQGQRRDRLYGISRYRYSRNEIVFKPVGSLERRAERVSD